MIKILYFIRAAHVLIITSHCTRLYISSEENDLIVKLLRVLEISSYFAIILYQQYFVIRFPLHHKGDRQVFRIKTYMMIELYIFYSLAVAASLFMFFIQIRGFLGKKNLDANKNRYKFDVLDYYEIDIEWLTFQTVPIGLCITGLLISKSIVRKSSHANNYILALIFTERVIQLFLM